MIYTKVPGLFFPDTLYRCRLLVAAVLSRWATHKRGLCRRAVSVCPFVRPSRSCILSKWVNISSNFFHHLFLWYQTLWQYYDWDPHQWGRWMQVR